MPARRDVAPPPPDSGGTRRTRTLVITCRPCEPLEADAKACDTLRCRGHNPEGTADKHGWRSRVLNGGGVRDAKNRTSVPLAP